MKKTFSLVAVLSLLAVGAFANDTMGAMVGANVTYSYPDGTTVIATYNADGTYATDIAGGGVWTIDGDRLCIKTDAGDDGCTTLAAGKGAGDTWEGEDAFGNPVVISIQ